MPTNSIDWFLVVGAILMFLSGLTCIFDPRFIWSKYYAPTMSKKPKNVEKHIIIFGIFLAGMGLLGIATFPDSL
jgi:heme/copper-type cytochrome/quinol oxidase subunit 1